jgi:hypothetical protein
MDGASVVTLMPEASVTRRRVDVAAGGTAVVGSCACEECGADLVLPALPGAWFRAVVHARADHWELENASIDAEAWMVDLEDPRSRIGVAPGRSRVVAPFEFTDLSFRVGSCEAGGHVTVIGPEPGSAADRNACPASLVPLNAAGLQQGTAYHAVLEELCRGGLTGSAVPSAAEIAARLRSRGWPLTPKAVEKHLDYLFRRCFPGESARGRGWKRAALVSMVTRTGDGA